MCCITRRQAYVVDLTTPESLILNYYGHGGKVRNTEIQKLTDTLVHLPYDTNPLVSCVYLSISIYYIPSFRSL